MFDMEKICNWFLRYVTGFCEDVRGVGCAHICNWFLSEDTSRSEDVRGVGHCRGLPHICNSFLRCRVPLS